MLNRTGRTEARAPAPPAVVLLVEDEPLLRRTTAEFLRLSGYFVIEASTAAEAIAEFDLGEPMDLVFADVCLSEPMDGLALARWLHRQYPDVPVMLTSGHGDAVRQAAIKLVGRESFLSKPYRQRELAGRIGRLIGSSSNMGHVAGCWSSKR
jgi:CheY-like chemotaxis protein